MSDFGIILLSIIVLSLAIALIRCLSWISDVQEQGGFMALFVRSLDKDYGKSVQGDPSDRALVAPFATTQQHSNNAIAKPQNDSNVVLLGAIKTKDEGKAEALAALVHAKKIGETEGIELVFKVRPSSTNPRYQNARALLKAELEKLQQPEYPLLTPEQHATRKELALEN